jgi:hypothetical protein
MYDELEPKIMTGWVLDGPRVDASLTNQLMSMTMTRKSGELLGENQVNFKNSL